MNNNPTYYAVLPADVRYDTQLSPQEKILYAEITALSNKEGVCFAGNKYFADLYSLTDVTISRQLSHLEEQGYVKIAYDKEGAKVKKRYITINKNVNGNPVALNKNVNRTINKNVKDNNTSILTLQDNNNISDEVKYLVAFFLECLRQNNPKTNRSEKQKLEYAKVFDELIGAYSVDEIRRMIKYATSSNFWKSICLSAKKISQHAEQLYIQMGSKTNPILDCDRVENTDVDFQEEKWIYNF